MLKSKIKSTILATLLSLGMAGGIAASATPAMAKVYNLDIQGAHASIHFKISHLGYSWVQARFNKFEGQFEFDESKPEASSISVTVDTTSLDSNHAERDKHLRSNQFFDVETFPTASFTSSSIEPTGDKKGILKGDLTIKGVTKPISMEVTWIGGGDDPWGYVRQGFEGTTVIPVGDYGMLDMGPTAQEVEISIYFEGVREK